jgi:hypothetical protein
MSQYVGETCRPLNVRVSEHKKKVKLGETHNSKLAEHAWEHEHHFNWEQAAPIIFEQNRFKRKFKESALMSITEKPISQASIEFPLVWQNIIKNCNPKQKQINESVTRTGLAVASLVDGRPQTNRPPIADQSQRTIQHTHATRYKSRQRNELFTTTAGHISTTEDGN